MWWVVGFLAISWPLVLGMSPQKSTKHSTIDQKIHSLLIVGFSADVPMSL